MAVKMSFTTNFGDMWCRIGSRHIPVGTHGEIFLRRIPFFITCLHKFFESFIFWKSFVNEISLFVFLAGIQIYTDISGCPQVLDL
jgi:hypothetical protein